MKKLIIALAALIVTSAAYGQGQVTFNNRVTGTVDAKILLPGGAGVAGGFTAQLYGGPVGGTLAALTPITDFRTGAAAGYVNSVDVNVPTVAPGATATLQVWVYETGKTYATSLTSGKSATFNVALGGGTLPPANIVGFTSFTLTTIPEPTTIALGLLGLAMVFFRRRK